MFNDYIDISRILNKLEGKEEFDSFVLMAGVSRMSLTINRIKNYLRLCDILKKKHEVEHFKSFSNKIKILEVSNAVLFSVPCKLDGMDDVADISIKDYDITLTFYNSDSDDITRTIHLDPSIELTDEQKVVLKTIWKLLEDQLDEFEKLAEELLAEKNEASS